MTGRIGGRGIGVVRGVVRGMLRLAVLCGLAGNVWAAEPATAPMAPRAGQPERTALSADRVTYTRQTVTAEGNVVIRRQGAELRVDRLVWDQASGHVDGKGNVSVIDGDSRLTATALNWNLNTGIGDIIDGQVTLERRYHLAGALISRVAADRYTIENGSFSSCPCRENGKRDWSVTARSIKMRIRGNLVARGVAFRVRDVPVFYFPVFVFPTSNRQTGLLIPSLGSDTRNGVRFEQPFYWAINPSQDLTATYNLRSKLGNGADLSYRYMTAPAAWGEVEINGLKDRSDSKLKGVARWRHATLNDHGWSWHADVNLVNDRNYFRVIGEAAEERTQESLESNLFGFNATDHTATSVLVRKTTDLAGAGGDTVQHLPRARAELFDRRVHNLPLWVGGHLDGVYLSRRVGESASRVDAAPKITLRATPFAGRATGVIRAGARWTWYNSDQADSAATLAESYPFEASLSGRLMGRLAGKPHLVMPQLVYRHVNVNRSDAAGFDLLERIEDEHELQAKLWQRWGGINWRLAAGYDLNDNTPLPVRSELDTTLGRTVVHLDTLHEAENGRLARVVSDLALIRGWGRVAVGNLYDRGTVGIGSAFDPSTLLAPADGVRGNFQSLAVALGPWHGWHFTHRLYYDWTDDRAAEARYGLGYGGSCWSFTVTYVDLPDRNVVRFRLALIGPEADGNLPGIEPIRLLGER